LELFYKDFKFWINNGDTKNYVVLQNNAQKYIEAFGKCYKMYYYIKSRCELLNYVVKIKGAINDQ